PRVGGARAASRAAEDVSARDMVFYSVSGRRARLLSSARPTVPILALSTHLLTIRRLLLSFGVQSHLMPKVERLREMLAVGEGILVAAGQVRPGDRVVVVSGSRAAHPGGTNMMKILTVGEEDPS
ncbi:MAG: pyruvate kinase alpha/beta domain-containing protein, partial [bacterium]